jgi:ABC-type polysaccharide/polyol phosphate transport system ATPase subunit
MSNPTAAVEVEHIVKEFRVPHEKVGSLKGHATRLFRRIPSTNKRVLDDISFTIQKGEFFSVIGANGSGKSTLLKLLAGIYVPTSGTITHRGSLTTMIELGVGFNFELSGRDNIYLNASLFGMTRAQVEAAYDTIVRFAEIGEFIDQKVKNYSSGMQVRLAFAIAIQADADIIVVDEVLAVGDANFQQKCFDVFRELKALGKTIIFVSHDLTAVQDFSDRVLLLNQSQQIGIFSPMEAINRYQRLNQAELEKSELNPLLEKQSMTKKDLANRQRVNKSKPHVASVSLLDKRGRPAKIIKRNDPCSIVLTVNNPALEPIEVGVSIVRNDGVFCFGTNTHIDTITVPVAELTEARLNIDGLAFQKGAYYIVVGVFSKGLRRVYEMRLKAKYFRIVQQDQTDGLVSLKRTWKFQ